MKQITFGEHCVNDQGKTPEKLKKSRHSRHQISLSQILVLGKVADLQKNVLNNLFINKYMSLTSIMLLTTTGIVIFILRRGIKISLIMTRQPKCQCKIKVIFK